MRRPLLILAATIASIPMLAGAAFAATPTAKPVAAKPTTAQSAATTTITAITNAINNGKGLALLTLMCAADRKALLLTMDAADFNDEMYEGSLDSRMTLKPLTTLGVSPTTLLTTTTNKRTKESYDDADRPEATLLLQNGKWCLAGVLAGAGDTGDYYRHIDTIEAAHAQDNFIAEHPRSAGVPLTVDATKKATTVYLGSAYVSFPVSKGTKMTVVTRPATKTTPGSFCISTVSVGATDPTLTYVYDSAREGVQPDGSTC